MFFLTHKDRYSHILPGRCSPPRYTPHRYLYMRDIHERRYYPRNSISYTVPYFHSAVPVLNMYQDQSYKSIEQHQMMVDQKHCLISMAEMSHLWR